MVIRPRFRPGSHALSAFLVSTGIVALAEIGDKTQLLAFVLAARFRKPLPIVLGIFVATIANHALAGAVGAWLTSVVPQHALRWILGLSFIGMALWTLIPDRLNEDETPVSHAGAFGATLVAFFLAEMGDKTQIATVALAAQYHAFLVDRRRYDAWDDARQRSRRRARRSHRPSDADAPRARRRRRDLCGPRDRHTCGCGRALRSLASGCKDLLADRPG